jgi:hypothetical protein
MTSLARRLRRIEAAFRPAFALGTALWQALALQHPLGEELGALREINEQGKQPEQSTERESEAVKVITSAFEQEVQKAGYATVREFQR